MRIYQFDNKQPKNDIEIRFNFLIIRSDFTATSYVRDREDKIYTWGNCSLQNYHQYNWLIQRREDGWIVNNFKFIQDDL